MVEKDLIIPFEELWGNKRIIKVSEKGREILRQALQPYVLFPKGKTGEKGQQCLCCKPHD
jgi:hypothetical protein